MLLEEEEEEKGLGFIIPSDDSCGWRRLRNDTHALRIINQIMCKSKGVCYAEDSRVRGSGNSINTLFVFLLFYIVPMVNHWVRLIPKMSNAWS